MTLKQVFIINQDLKMGKGKIAVQVAHGEVFYLEHIFINKKNSNDLEIGKNFLNYLKWRKDGLMKKVVLKATQKQMSNLIGIMEMVNETDIRKIWYNIIYDRGLTQVPANSMTCIVMEPLDEQLADHHFGHLKLL